ncbi:hypothetical protein TKK_0014359 [Trichogramma kaykai]
MMDQSYQDCLTTLKTMREEFDWEIEEERVHFLRRLDPLIQCWKGQLPNFRDIFRPEEIDWLLSESTKNVTSGYDETPGERFISFVARSGYKDEPDVDEDGKPLLRRNTPIHEAFGYRHMIYELFKIYDRFDANYIEESGLTHFHVVCMSGCYDIVEKFLELGQDPNILVPKIDYSPLHYAITFKHEKVVALLLRNAADPNLANYNGMTPLHLICNYTSILVRIIKKDVDRLFDLKSTNFRETKEKLCLSSFRWADPGLILFFRADQSTWLGLNIIKNFI